MIISDISSSKMTIHNNVDSRKKKLPMECGGTDLSMFNFNFLLTCYSNFCFFFIIQQYLPCIFHIILYKIKYPETSFSCEMIFTKVRNHNIFFKTKFIKFERDQRSRTKIQSASLLGKHPSVRHSLVPEAVNNLNTGSLCRELRKSVLCHTSRTPNIVNIYFYKSKLRKISTSVIHVIFSILTVNIDCH